MPCISQFCRWLDLSQHKYDKIKNKPSRYKLVGRFDYKGIVCNDIPTDDYEGIVVDYWAIPLSNWSLAVIIQMPFTSVAGAAVIHRNINAKYAKRLLI